MNYDETLAALEPLIEAADVEREKHKTAINSNSELLKKCQAELADDPENEELQIAIEQAEMICYGDTLIWDRLERKHANLSGQLTDMAQNEIYWRRIFEIVAMLKNTTLQKLESEEQQNILNLVRMTMPTEHRLRPIFNREFGEI